MSVVELNLQHWNNVLPIEMPDLKMLQWVVLEGNDKWRILLFSLEDMLSSNGLTCSMYVIVCFVCSAFLTNMITNRLSLCLFFPCPSAVRLHLTSSLGKTFGFNVSACFLFCFLTGAGCLDLFFFFSYNGFLPRCSELVHAEREIVALFVAALLLLFWFLDSSHVYVRVFSCMLELLQVCVCVWSLWLWSIGKGCGQKQSHFKNQQ